MAKKNIPDVMDLDPPAATRKRELEGSDVPPQSPHRRGGEMDLTMEGIGKLLARQTAELQQMQDEKMEKAIAVWEKRTLGAIGDVKNEIKKEAARTQESLDAVRAQQDDMKRSQSALADRVAFLEQKALNGGSTTASESSGPRRPALVFGGWPPEAARHVVLGDLKTILDKVGAASLMDEQGWTPGPRKGIALATFRPRSGEGPEEVKARMLQIVSKINQSKTGTPNTMESRPIWCALSRDRARAKAPMSARCGRSATSWRLTLARANATTRREVCGWGPN